MFYQATAADPQGVVRRRVLRCNGPRVVAVEDDLLDAEADSDLVVVGEGALMAQLSRARDRTMHSIVATIQAEQDKAIRAPSKGVVSIAGGPGTGKTVVALHRAAYLLYSDRRRYETRRRADRRAVRGVHALHRAGAARRSARPPSRCARWARSSTGSASSRHDDPAVADVKGSARMAELMRRTARIGVPDAPDELRVFYRDDNIVLSPARAQPGPAAAAVAGPAQPAGAARRVDAARRDVAAGARRARP